ncbi:unnamed protein product [Meganyctiphanes norvegica]|uniref:Uncharacterized protein n=1 Tax=Meganyctiphanes norvegica TaxID=48144 RepID=A0AAV2S2Z8_MEGNR
MKKLVLALTMLGIVYTVWGMTPKNYGALDNTFWEDPWGPQAFSRSKRDPALITLGAITACTSIISTTWNIGQSFKPKGRSVKINVRNELGNVALSNIKPSKVDGDFPINPPHIKPCSEETMTSTSSSLKGPSGILRWRIITKDVTLTVHVFWKVPGPLNSSSRNSLGLHLSDAESMKDDDIRPRGMYKYFIEQVNNKNDKTKDFCRDKSSCDLTQSKRNIEVTATIGSGKNPTILVIVALEGAQHLLDNVDAVKSCVNNNCQK